jgi:GNAT superfamily N-acetyltransferase
MDCIIKRDLENVDWDELAELYWAGMVVDGVAPELQIPKPAGAEWERYVQITRQEFAGSDLTCLVYVDGKCVGGAHAVTDGARDGGIFGLVAHGDYRGRGLGTRIMQELLKDLRNVSVILNASEKSEGIFRKLGFRTLRRGMALRYSEEDFAD